jgi:hypothetical protein
LWAAAYPIQYAVQDREEPVAQLRQVVDIILAQLYGNVNDRATLCDLK